LATPDRGGGQSAGPELEERAAILAARAPALARHVACFVARMARAPLRYGRHRPEATVLYGLVQKHLESFLWHVRESTERRLPRYVEQEFRRLLGSAIPMQFWRTTCSARARSAFRSGLAVR
jgi:hypothetical protein